MLTVHDLSLCDFRKAATPYFGEVGKIDSRCHHAFARPWLTSLFCLRRIPWDGLACDVLS